MTPHHNSFSLDLLHSVWNRPSTFFLKWALFLLFLSTFSFGDPVYKLFGVVSTGSYQGYLIEINTATGEGTPIGNTGLTMPAGLTSNWSTGTVYATDGFGGGPRYTINPATGASTPLDITPASVGGCLAYRPADSYLYSTVTGVSTSTLYYFNSTTGAYIDFIGIINKNTGALAVRPSDNVLFGAGSAGVHEWVFTISTTPGPPPRETDIGETGQMITGMAFDSTGTLYATNSSNLYSVNTSSGALTLIGPHSGAETIGFVAGLTFAPVSLDGDVDLWIKDCGDDDGTVPSIPENCPHWWTSPDIWIDNNNDMIIDAPVVGVNNTLKALVRNRGGISAHDVSVTFYYRDNSTGLIFPDGANVIGEDIVTVTDGGMALASVTWEDLPAPPATGGHWCIGVVLDHPDDPRIVPTVQPPNDNNVGIANIWFITGRAGEEVVLPFDAGTGGKSGFGMSPWPREFKMEIESTLPEDWEWTLDIPTDTPFVLKLGEIRTVHLKINVAEGASPHSGGFVDVRQVDVETGKKVGGVHFDVYEDKLPPETVSGLSITLLDNQPMLTWLPVLKEQGTGLRERVAYYSVIRDGKHVAKVVGDVDPAAPGIQWIDTSSSPGSHTYTVNAVDEGNNKSAASSATSVTVFNEDGGTNQRCFLIIIVLLVIILLLLVLLFKRR